MSEEQDSWFKSAFGVDLSEAANKIKEGASAAASAVAGAASQAVEAAAAAAKSAVEAVSGTPAAAPTRAPAPGGAAEGSAPLPAGSFPLRGSVGRGGQNAANDVCAVQRALGIAVDGKCGPQTIGSIEAFQRKIGQAAPDGRVDAGGATERALVGGGAPAPASPPPAAPPAAPQTPAPPAPGGGILDRIEQTASGVVEDVKAFGEKVVEGAEKTVTGLKERVEEAVHGGPGGEGEGSRPQGPGSAPLPEHVRLQLASLVNSQLNAELSKEGLIAEINALDEFTATDPDPVPEPQLATGLARRSLELKLQEVAVSLSASQRKRDAILKKARDDARAAIDDAQDALLLACIPTATATAIAIGVVVVVGTGGLAAAVTAVAAGVNAIIQGHTQTKKLQSTLRALITRAKADLLVVNTAIAVQRKTIERVKRELPGAPDI